MKTRCRHYFFAQLLAIVLVIALLPVTVYALPGDLNGSGRVDGFDLIMFGRANGSQSQDATWNPDADLNRDEIVDSKDLEILSTHFGRNGMSFGLWVGSRYNTNDRLFKLSAKGNILQQLNNFSYPRSISGNIADNTIWIADSSDHKVYRMSGFDGSQKIEINGMQPYAVCVDPRDGSAWVADYGNNRVVKLSPAIADGYTVDTDTGSHLVVNGFSRPQWISVNPATGTIWVADTGDGSVVRLSADITDGYDISTDVGSHTDKSGFNSPYSVSVNGADGTVWVADYGNNQVVKLSATGTTEIVRISGFRQPMSVDTSFIDGSVWVADHGNNQVVRLASDGAIICRTSGFNQPYAVGVNPLDASAWVADYGNNQVVKLSSSGNELMRINGISSPASIAVFPDDVSTGRYPSVSAAVDTPNAATNTPITFMGTGNDPDGRIRLYEWDFDGDGTFDFSSKTPVATTHAYPEEGLYNPVFRVTDNDWLTATDYSLIIRVGTLKASAAADVVSGTAPLTVSFSGSFVDPLDGYVDSYQWDFDGNNIFNYFSDTTADTTFTYDKAGTYVATLKVTDGPHAAVDSITIQVNPSAPEASADADPKVGRPPLKVQFTGSGTDPDGKVLLYEWDFDGDGIYDWSSVSSPDTTYTYPDEGEYTAGLKVTDNDGMIGTATVDITVNASLVPLKSIAVVDKSSGNAPLTVNFDGSGSTGNIVKYEWNFGHCPLFYDSMDTDSGNWIAGGTWARTRAQFHSRSYAWTDSPGTNYPDDSDTALTSKALDFSEVENATLSFWHRYSTYSYYDRCRVELSTDGGTSWSQIKSYYGQQIQWNRQSIDISNYLPAPDLRIRFRLTTDSSNTSDGWYVDDIQICSDADNWVTDEDGQVSYTYPQSGLFTAQLRVTDDTEAMDITDIHIEVTPETFPSAVVTASPVEGDVPLKVDFTASASASDEGRSIVSYRWNFGEAYVWVADTRHDQVARLFHDGSGEMARVDGFNDPSSITVDPSDGTLWVADKYNDQVVKLTADGRMELLRVSGFDSPYCVTIDPSDSSVWVADYSHNQIVKLDADGTEQVRVNGFSRPTHISLNPSDGSVWVADYNHNQVVKLDRNGTELIRISGFSSPGTLAVNPADGTVWVSNESNDTVVKLSADIANGYDYTTDTGSHQVIDGFDFPAGITVNSADNSVWVADRYHNEVVHLAADGTEILRTGGFYRPVAVAVNSTTGNVWVADTSNHQVVLLSAAGREISRMDGFNSPGGVTIVSSGSGNFFTSETTGNTSHTYTSPGIYHAVFTAEDNDGFTVSQSVDITVAGGPHVTAKANTTTGTAPVEVYFSADITDKTGIITSYQWDFDGNGTYDSQSDATANIRHIYPAAGTYEAKVNVINDVGQSDTDTVTITVSSASPEAFAQATPAQGNTPLTVNFTGTGTDVDGSIVKYEWDFENNGTYDFTSAATGMTSHTYTAQGDYTAVLRVTDDDGRTGTDTVQIQAYPASQPLALIENTDRLKGYTPYRSDFYVQGLDPDGSIVKYEIDFNGDGTFETIQPTAFGDNAEAGTMNWTAEGTWARTTRAAHSPAYSWTDSPETDYADDTDASLTSKTIDLSSATTPKLVFWHKYEFQYGDYGRVEISSNDGASWSQVKYYSNNTLDTWQRVELDLSSYAGNATVKLRFRLTSNSADTADGWYIDDVWVGEPVSHIFTAAGEYPVTLRVTDNEGNTHTSSRTVTVAANENMSRIWVTDHYNNQVVRLSDLGDTLARINGFNRPLMVAADPVTGDAWVTDKYNDRIVKLSPETPDGYNVGYAYATDASPQQSHGVLYGNTVLSDQGQLNKSMYFDGSGDYIQIPDIEEYNTSAWTMEAWIRPEILTGNRTVLGKVSQAKDRALIMTADKISFLYYQSGRKYLEAPTPLIADQWYHVAVTYDGTTGAIKLYLDGTLAIETTATLDMTNTDPLMIGRSNCCSEYFQGWIDDVRVWHTVKSQAELSSGRTSELTGNEAGLAGYWQLNSDAPPYHKIIDGFDDPEGISVNSSTHNAWVADTRNNRIIQISPQGAILKRIYGFNTPLNVLADPDNGNVWVADASAMTRLNQTAIDGYFARADKLTPDETNAQKPGMVAGGPGSDTGKLSGCLKLDGSNDYIVIPPDPALDVQNFTVEAWVKNDSSVYNRTIFMRANNEGGNELYFGFDTSNTLEAILDNGSANKFTNTDTPVDFQDGEWHHVALTYDGSQLICYVDGTEYGTPAALSATLDFGDSQALIGADFDRFNSALGNYYPGYIDEVRIFNSARTKAEINDAMAAEIPSGTSGLVGYWKLNSLSPGSALTVTGFSSPYGLSLDPSDHGIWVADRNNDQVVKLAQEGTRMYTKGGYSSPHWIDADPATQGAWISDYNNDRIIKIRSDGVETHWLYGFDNPADIKVNPDDATAWVADRYNDQVVKLSADGTELLRLSGFNDPWSVSIDPAGRLKNDPPSVTAEAAPAAGDAPLTVSFNADATDNGTIIAYSWDFDGDGRFDWSSNTTATTQYTYDTPGTYAPLCRVTDDNNLAGYASPGPIHVGPVTITPIVSPKTGNSPLNVTLEAEATGLDKGVNVETWEWDFNGDGIYDFISTQSAKTTHTYSPGGAYTAILRVTDTQGNQFFAASTITAVKQPPSVNNYASPTTGNAPLNVVLDGYANDPDGAIVFYEWDYNGDGAYDWFSTTTADTEFTYSTPGTYDTVFRATDNDGLTTQATKTITVGQAQLPPRATLSASADKGPAPLAVDFTGIGTDDDGQIQLYEWDIDGDGVYDASATDTGDISHTYTTPGQYNAIFRVTDSDGLTDTETKLITVQSAGAPNAVANATPQNGTTPLTVEFTATGSNDPDGSIVQYDWFFDSDPEVWVADHYNNKVKQLHGYQVVKEVDNLSRPYRLSMLPDKTLWLTEYNNNQVVRLSADGKTEIARADGFYYPYGIAASPSDNGAWVADYNHHQVVKLDGTGTEQLRLDGFDNPTSVAVSPVDDTIWVTDRDHHQVVRLDADGNERQRFSGFYYPSWVTVDNSDGSVWIADKSNNRIVKLSADAPKGYHTDVHSVTPEEISEEIPTMAFGQTTRQGGNLSDGLYLDGSGDYLLIPDGTFPDLTDFTLEAWIKGEYVHNSALFMRGNADGGNEIYIGFYGNSAIEVILDNGSSQRFSGNLNFIDNAWHHVAVTYDATTQTLSCFVNGEAYGTPVTLSAAMEFQGSHALIGADYDGFNTSLGNYFKGTIDEVRLWNTARTPTQLDASKDAELDGSESGLISYWKLNTLDPTPYHQTLGGFNQPQFIALNPANGIAWVCDYNNNQMVKVSRDCTRELARIDGFNHPHEAAVNPRNGSVWVADTDHHQIAVLDAGGRLLQRIDGFNRPTSLLITPDTGKHISLTSDQPVEHTYPNTGKYSAALRVTDDQGNTDTDTIVIKAGSYPEALAIAYPTTGTVPLTVRFAANAKSPAGTIETFEWDFDGDGTRDWYTVISENKEHTFTKPGVYTATLTVTDNQGLQDVKTVTITVLKPNEGPEVFASADPKNGYPPLEVTFTGLGKSANTTLKLFEWDFNGDGSYDYSSNTSGITSHTYAAAGLYNAVFRATDQAGNSTTERVRVNVKPIGAPTATIQASVTSGSAALEVQFNGSGGEKENIVTYEWDFNGDGVYDVTSATATQVDHVYTIPGAYNALLRITNDQGLSDTAMVTINVSAGVSASLSLDSFDPTAGETIDINSVLTSQAKVSIKITDRTGKLLRALVTDETRSSGYYTDTWDGKDDKGAILESGVYLYTIEYETGGTTYVYDLTNDVDPANQIITPDYPSTFNPFNAETNFFRYTLDAKSEITVYISPFVGGAQTRAKTLLLRQPQKAGSYVLVWDGTDDSGDLVEAMSYVLAVFQWPLPDNAIIINTSPVISDPSINPVYLNPDAHPYDDENRTEITFTLSKESDVILSIFDASNYIIRTVTLEKVPAGPGNKIYWDGKNSSGKNVTPGVYRTKLIATDANGSKSLDANALLIIFY
ncbi:PKD domain-containing protein [Desulfobacter latus]|uniref:PKD domain-containing protein n=1 Tax=Desulfobacter latus TaxID=2292 RepID=A0A850TA12_9BACT|nr:PKD domain-containing protein [Desulfobacter latus]NWH05408.1 PKD domain-containing protein [Desulfobacter latus]